MSDVFKSIAAGLFYLAMGLMALVAVGRFVWAVWPEGWRGDGAAGWVQAVGGLMGIGIAIYVPWKQRRDAIRIERSNYFRARADAAEKLELVAFELHEYMQSAVERSTNTEAGILVFRIGHAEGEELQARLMKLHDLPFADLDGWILQLRRVLDRALKIHGPTGHITIQPGKGPTDSPYYGLLTKVREIRRDVDSYRSGTLDILHGLDSKSYPLVVLVSTP